MVVFKVNDRRWHVGVRRLSLVGMVHVLVLAALFSSGCRTLKAPSFSAITESIAPGDGSQEQPFEALDDIDPKVRKKGATALGQITPVKNRYMDIYVAGLDPRDSQKTLKSIADIGDMVENTGPVVEALANACRDYDAGVRHESIASLQLIYQQIVLAIAPLNKLVTDMKSEESESNESIIKAADETLRITENQVQKIVTTMTTAQNDPVRSNRNLTEKFMYIAKNRPRAILQKKPLATAKIREEEILETVEPTAKKPQDSAEKISDQEPEEVLVTVPEVVSPEQDPVVEKEEKGSSLADSAPVIVDSTPVLPVTGDLVAVEKEGPDKKEDTAVAAAKEEPAAKALTDEALENSAVKKPESLDGSETAVLTPPAPEKKDTGKKEETHSSDQAVAGYLRQLESFELANRRFALASMTAFIQDELMPVQEKIGSVTKGDIAIRSKAVEDINERVRRMENLVTALCRSSEDVDTEIRTRSLKNLAEMISPLCLVLEPFESAPKEIEDTLTREKVDVDPLVRIQIDQFKRATGEGTRRVSQMVEKTVPFFLKSLNDPKIEVRNGAGEGLKGILAGSGGQDPLKPVWATIFTNLDMKPVDVKIRLLMNDLESPGVDLARSAARDLTELGPVAVAAVPALIKVVKNRSNLHVHYKYVQMDAMAALGNMGKEAAAAVPALKEQLGDIRFEIRSSAVLALGQIGGKDGTTEIVDMLENDKSALVRESAAYALSSLDLSDCLDKAYSLLFKTLRDSSATTRMNAFNALAAQELKNRAAGILRWKPAAKVPNHYRVCVGAAPNGGKECLDAGLSTVFRLGDFKNVPRGGQGVEVLAVREESTEPVTYQFVDVVSILEKSATSESNATMKEKKNKALLELMKSLLVSSGIKQSGRGEVAR